jgi:alkylation response protein AidB-like acyl-CoA dehydrogenase
MQRTIFDADHEAFRASAREYADRTLTPRMDEFLEAKTFPRDIWLEAGKQGFLGLDVPEEYGGSSAGDYLFNAVFHEELAKVSLSVSSCLTASPAPGGTPGSPRSGPEATRS